MLVRKLCKNGFNIKISKPKLVNIFVTAMLNKKIDIEKVAEKLPRSRYEPENYPHLIHRMLNPETSVWMYSSGKIQFNVKNNGDVNKVIGEINFELEQKECFID